MSATARREQVLTAATAAFARAGYAGTTTDVVARAAGVSQPYVVRMFGSKLDLFLAVFDRTTTRIEAAFRAVLERGPAEGADDEEVWDRLGAAYFELLADRDLLLVLMHGFAAGDDEAIGARARIGMGRIYDVLRGTGAPAERLVAFISHGMLLNVLISMRAAEHPTDSAALAHLTASAFGDKPMTTGPGVPQPD